MELGGTAGSAFRTLRSGTESGTSVAAPSAAREARKVGISCQFHKLLRALLPSRVSLSGVSWRRAGGSSAVPSRWRYGSELSWFLLATFTLGAAFRCRALSGRGPLPAPVPPAQPPRPAPLGSAAVTPLTRAAGPEAAGAGPDGGQRRWAAERPRERPAPRRCDRRVRAGTARGNGTGTGRDRGAGAAILSAAGPRRPRCPCARCRWSRSGPLGPGLPRPALPCPRGGTKAASPGQGQRGRSAGRGAVEPGQAARGAPARPGEPLVWLCPVRVKRKEKELRCSNNNNSARPARSGAQAKCGREPSEASPAAALELIIGSVCSLARSRLCRGLQRRESLVI